MKSTTNALPTRFRWSILLCPPLLAWARAEIRSQSAPTIADEIPTAAQHDLTQDVEAEQRRGTYVFHTQTYRSGRSQVLFKGSVFGVIQKLDSKGCELSVETTVTDRYSGSIGKKLIGETSSVYRSSFEFALTSEVADTMHLVEARPAQLGVGTSPICTGKTGCKFEWVEVEAAHPVIREVHVTNDVDDYDGYVKDFDGMVDHFLIPISSPDAGNDLISKFRAFAKVCGRPWSAPPSAGYSVIARRCLCRRTSSSAGEALSRPARRAWRYSQALLS